MRIMNKVPKSHNARHGKGGFTLVELCVVLALLAILTAAIASFSVLMNSYAVEASQETDFWEDTATLKSELRKWVAENDVSSNTFSVKNGALTVTPQNGAAQSVYFSGDTLTLVGNAKGGFAAIDGVAFSCPNDRLIKCTAFRITESGERKEVSFVFSVRSAKIEPTATGEVSADE